MEFKTAEVTPFMSRRKERQHQRQRRARQQVVLAIGTVVLLAFAGIGFSIYQSTRPIGDIKAVARESFPFPQGKVLGAADSPVTVQLFSDFQCPYCGLYALRHERQLIDDYVAAGQVRLEYRHYIVVDGNVGGRESRMAAQASECAVEQNDFWNYHNLVFANQDGEGQGAFTGRRLKAFAETLGLDTAAFNSCFDSGRYAQAVMSDEQLARSMGVNSTPTMFVNGQRIENPLDYGEIKQAIENALAAAR
jgi:protein-disulfide isomerase